MRSRVLIGAVTGVAALTLVAACSSNKSSDDKGGSTGGNGGGSKVTLKFQSLAFQKPTVAAVKKIVNDWNAAHPNIQVQYSEGSWDSVHDQLVTQFEGGAAPDIIHDEAADISGFIQQGYLADLSGDLPDGVKSSVPQG